MNFKLIEGAAPRTRLDRITVGAFLTMISLLTNVACAQNDASPGAGAVAAVPVAGEDATALPTATELLPAGGAQLRLAGTPDATLQNAPIAGRAGLPAGSATDPAFARGARVTVKRETDPPYKVQLLAPLSQAIRQGDVVALEFWARGELLPDPNRATGSNLAQVEMRLEQNRAPFQSAGSQSFFVTPEWKKYSAVFASSLDLAAGQGTVNFRLGFAPQTVEITGLRARSYGQTLPVARVVQLLQPGSKRHADPAMGRDLPVWAPEKPSRPPLRPEVSLDGTWKFTPMPDGTLGKPNEIPVPEYWDAKPGFDTDQAVYEREVSVPADWTGQQVWVEFEGVAQSAEVFIGGESAGTHVGGWTPFRVDASRWAKPGQSFALKVIVRGGNLPPITSEAGKLAWPVGWQGNSSRWGLCFPVWLRAYGAVNIEDAFIQPSVKNQSLTVDYTLHNAQSQPRTVTVQASCALPGQNAPLVKFASPAVTLKAGETRVVKVSTPFADAPLWSPDEPQLLLLRSQVVEGGQQVDAETRRFGFREITIGGNQYTLNGVRLNLRGNNINTHAQGFNDGRYNQMWPGKWEGSIAQMKSFGVNAVRFHMSPAPDWMLDKCDETGLLVIAESAAYARDYVKNADRAAYVKNSRTWLADWVPGSRNHPSIVLWSAENELGVGWLKYLSDAELLSLGAVVHRADPTRPVIYEGDRDIGDSTVSYHYPEGYKNSPKGSIYSWAGRVKPDKPTSVTEFITSYGDNEADNLWWQGTWTRGLRYTNWADIRPYTIGWAISSPDKPQARNLRNSLAAVALFDKAYDDLGIAPLKDNALPTLNAGAAVERTLVLYNDEFRDPKVSVEVSLRAGGKTLATARRDYQLQMGTHRDLTATFTVPNVGDGTLELVLKTFKGERATFEEAKRFKVNAGGAGGAGEAKIGLSQ